MKITKKIIKISIFTIILILFLGLFPSASLFADIISPAQIDVVLVIDVSGSMLSSDPEKVSFEAMKMFVDMTTFSGDKIGIVAYSDKIEREKALLTINTVEDKKTLHDFITQLEFIGLNTDIPLGLKEAAIVLGNGRDKSHKPLIILLTDGRNDLTRSEEQAETDLQGAISVGFPIYTIGLNVNGKVDNAYLERISEESNARAFITDKAEDLPQILTEIFANHLKLKPLIIDSFEASGDFQTVDIPILNENVLEANICILSSKPVETRLYDPMKVEVAIPSEDIYFSKSSKYSLIKIISPKKGIWILDVKGVKKDQIAINIIFNYDIKVIMENLPKEQFSINENIRVKAFLESEDERIQDKELYGSIQSKIILVDSGSGKVEEILMESIDDSFIGDLKVSKPGNYEIFIRSEAETFFRESESLKFEVTQDNITQDNIKVETKENKWLIPLLSSIGGLIILLIIIFFLIKLIKNKNRNLVGQVVLIVKEKDGTESNPRFRHLNDYKGKVRIFELLSEKTEFEETKDIYLLPGKLENIVIKNLSNAQIEKFGEIIDAKTGYELNKNDSITIFLKGSDKNITLEYKF